MAHSATLPPSIFEQPIKFKHPFEKDASGEHGIAVNFQHLRFFGNIEAV
jgi:hypothetical protein